MAAIRLIGVPMDLGADRRGVDMGPSAIRYGDVSTGVGLTTRLEKIGHSCTDSGDITVPNPEDRDPSRLDENSSHAKYIEDVEEVCADLSREIKEALQSEDMPIVLGGDHSIAIGSINGTAATTEVGVLWFDAHSDLNTPSTTPSGNVHGMPLAAVLGLGDFAEQKYEWARAPNLREENVVIIGLRSVDEAERDIIRDTDITSYTMSEIDERGISTIIDEALDHIHSNVDQLHVSFDLDWLDPLEAPGVGTPVSGGATYREAHFALETIAKYTESDSFLRSLEFVEVNPILDQHNKTASLAGELIASTVGERIL